MGIERLAIASAAALAMQLCGSDDEPEPTGDVPAIEGTAAIEVSADVDLPPPAYGGTVVAAGDYPVEVLPYEDGTVHAYVLADEPPPPSQTQITVRVPGDDGDVHPVMLVWDPSVELYRGRLRTVHPAPGPVEVVMVHDGHRYRGAGPRVVIVGPSPPTAVLEVEAPDRPEVVVERPDPRVQVVVDRPEPRVQVRVEAPGPPRPQVVVHHPGPPTVRVEHHAPSVRVEHRSPRVRVRHDNGLHLGHRRGHKNVRVRARGGRGRGGARVRVRH